MNPQYYTLMLIYIKIWSSFIASAKKTPTKYISQVKVFYIQQRRENIFSFWVKKIIIKNGKAYLCKKYIALYKSYKS